MSKTRKTRSQKEKAQARRELSNLRQPERKQATQDREQASATYQPLQPLSELDIAQFPWTAEQNRLRNKLRDIIDLKKQAGAVELADQFLQLRDNLIRHCEALYTPFMYKNTELCAAAKQTVVPYYHGSFEAHQSRQISFLPLELRLFIYVEMLKIETDRYYSAHILNRISITLSKMYRWDELDLSVFVLSWTEYNLFMCDFLTAYSHVQGFFFLGYGAFRSRRKLDTLLQFHKKEFQRIPPLREKTMKTALLDGAELLDKEFWYGMNSFSNLDAIQDRTAARLCLRLFTLYFEKVFLCAAEFETLILDFYRSADKTELNQFLKRHQLDEVNMHSYVSYADGISGEEIGTVKRW